MKESFPTPESAPVSRQDVIDAYKKFSEKGIGDPAGLDMTDPEVRKAHKLYDAWRILGDKKAENDEELWHRHNFDKTMIYIDAGFTGENYLMDALDWLMQDAQNIEKIPNNIERQKTIDLIAKAIKKIRKLLEKYN
jgi:hypothetical protein